MKNYFFLFLLIFSVQHLHSQTTYKQGDIITINGTKGIVFYVDETGEHGTAMSVNAFRSKKNLFCTKSSMLNKINMTNPDNGQKNTQELYNYANQKRISLSLFPVFHWCKSLGDKWYIPSIEQLKEFINYWLGNSITIDWDDENTEEDSSETGINHKKKVNHILLDAGGIPFLNGVFSSTIDKKGKLVVFNYDSQKDVWEFIKVDPMKIDQYCTGRAFCDF